MIKSESCKGTRKPERQKFNMSKGQIDGGKNDSNTNENNNATECGETTKVAISLTSSEKGESKSNDTSTNNNNNNNGSNSKQEETTVVVVNDNNTAVTRNTTEEAMIKKLFLYVSYGGKEKVITGIEMVSGSKGS